MKFKSRFCIGLLALLACSIIPLQAQVGFSEFATGGTALNSGTNWAIIPAELAGQTVSATGIPTPPQPVADFLACRGFAVTPITLQSYYSTNGTYFSGPATAGLLTTNYVPWPNGTNGFLTGQWAVIHHGPFINSVSITNIINGETNFITRNTVSYLPDQIADEAVQISSFPPGIQLVTNTAVSGATTNTWITTNLPIAFVNAPLQTVNPNDELYQETAAASLAVPTQGTVTEFPANGLFRMAGQRRKPMLFLLQSTGVGTNYIDALDSIFIP